MRKLSLAALSIALFALPSAVAQVPAGCVQVSGSGVQSAGGAAGGVLVANGAITFSPVASSGVPISFLSACKVPGQAALTPVSVPIVTGAFSILLPDTALTTPKNVCFATKAVDKATGNSLLGPGYTCLQPHATPTGAGDWCQASGCNLDNYPPNLAALVTVQTGPVGATGAPGATGATGGMTTVNGATGAFVLNGAGASCSTASGTTTCTIASGLPAGVVSDNAGGLGVAGQLSAATLQAASIEQGANDANVPYSSVLLKAATMPVTVLYIGDSITLGSGAPTNGQGWANNTFNQLASTTSGQQGQYCANASTCGGALSGSWAATTLASHQAGLFTTVSAGTASATITWPWYQLMNSGAASTISIFYYTYTDSAAFCVTQNGASSGCFGGTTTATYQPAIATFPVTAVPIVLTAPVSGHAYIYGMQSNTAASNGLIYANVAFPGVSSIAYSTDLSWLNFVTTPAIAIVALGQNDGWADATTLIANHAAIHAALAAKNIPEAIIITEPGSSWSPANDLVVNALITWAGTQGIPVVNIWNAWGSYAAGNALGLYADGVHPSLLGHTDIAKRVMNKLFPGTIPQVFPTLQAATVTATTSMSTPSISIGGGGSTITGGPFGSTVCYNMMPGAGGSNFLAKMCSTNYGSLDLTSFSAGGNSPITISPSGLLSAKFASDDARLHLYYGLTMEPGSYILDANGATILGSLTTVTTSIGGSALTAGQCTSGTVAAAKSTAGMAVDASPVTYPGDSYYWRGYVSVAGTVTVKVCATVAGTPLASAYNVRVIQ